MDRELINCFSQLIITIASFCCDLRCFGKDWQSNDDSQYQNGTKECPTMIENVGMKDRLIRSAVGGALLMLLFVLSGAMKIFGLVGIFLLVTAWITHCPIYKMMGVNTCPIGDH